MVVSSDSDNAPSWVQVEVQLGLGGNVVLRQRFINDQSLGSVQHALKQELGVEEFSKIYKFLFAQEPSGVHAGFDNDDGDAYIQISRTTAGRDVHRASKESGHAVRILALQRECTARV